MDTSKLFILITCILLFYSCNRAIKPYVEIYIEKDTVYTDEINTAKIYLRNYFDKENMPSFYLGAHGEEPRWIEDDTANMAGKIGFDYSFPTEAKYFGFVIYPKDGSYDTIKYSLTFTVIEKE